jgi:hypothetical protein
MNLWRNLVVLGVCSAAGATGAAAQTAITPFALNNTVSLDGLTATITSLSCPASGCTSGDQLEIVTVSRGNLEFEVVNSSASSSIFAAPTGSNSTVTETLAFTIKIAPTSGYTHRIGTPTKVTESATGWQAYSTCSTCSQESAPISAAFTGSSVTTNPLAGALPLQTQDTTASQVSFTSSTDSITTAASPFVISSTLQLINNGNTATKLEFDAYALTLHTAPEPASVAVLLIGLGGLAMARRRRI